MELLLTKGWENFREYTAGSAVLIDEASTMVKERLVQTKIHAPESVKTEIERYVTGCRWPARRMEYSFVLRAVDRFTESSGITDILDIGSGPSVFPGVLASRYPGTIRCIDRDPAMVQAMKELGVPGCSYSVSDMGSLPFEDESFDVITCVSVLEHVNREEGLAAVSEMLRVVKKRGIVVLTIDYRSLDFFSNLRKWNKRFFKAGAFLLRGRGADLVRAVSSPKPYTWKDLKDFISHHGDFVVGVPDKKWASLNVRTIRKFWADNRKPEFQYDPKTRDYTSIGLLLTPNPDLRDAFRSGLIQS